MRLLSARLIIALMVGVIGVSLGSSEYEVYLAKRNLKRDLQRRAELLGESLAGNVFTGAAHELGDALQVNPYDIDQMAETIRAAVEMDPEEKQKRMKRMRRTVREHNVYHWAANLNVEVCELPVGQLENVSESPPARTPAG